MFLLHRCSEARRPRRTFRLRAWRFVLALAVHIGAMTASFAEPSVPSDDDVVLERVAAGSELRQFQALRAALAATPHDVNAALKLARAYLDVGRTHSDPRFISYAQATLVPWVQRPDASVEALILLAITLQSSHRFDEALVLLERALSVEPRNSQAWLTRATILQVRGEFSAARGACARLIGNADALVALACIASVDAMTGKLSASYAALDRAVENDLTQADEIHSWLLGQLGEMSVRLGRHDDAERHFKAALAANPLDPYIKGEYADLLLRQRRAAEVIALLSDHEAQDALLLRLAQAELALKVKRQRWVPMYEARYAAARRDADFTHLREHARYALEIRRNAAAALELAQRNWQAQREPADVRILTLAAHAARDQQALSRIVAWIDDHSYQDDALNSVLTLSNTERR